MPSSGPYTTAPLMINRVVRRPRAPSWESPDTLFVSSEYTKVNRLMANAYKTQAPGRLAETISRRGVDDSVARFNRLDAELSARHHVYMSNNRQFNASMQHIP